MFDELEKLTPEARANVHDALMGAMHAKAAGKEPSKSE